MPIRCVRARAPGVRGAVAGRLGRRSAAFVERRAAKKSILQFVAKVTTGGSPDFVPPAERIAVFDNDGTLWAEQPMYFQFLFMLDRVKALAPQHPEWKTKEPFASLLKGDVKAALAGGERAVGQLAHGDARGHDDRGVREDRQRLDRDREAPEDGAAAHRDGLSADARAARLPARERVQDVHRLRRRHRVHAPVVGTGVRHPARAGHRQQHQDEVRAARRQAGARPPARDQLHGRRPRQARGHPDAHRPPAARRVWQLRRRPADAPVDRRRPRPALLPLRSPHRRRARVGLRPRLRHRPPGQGSRRGEGQRLDRRGHEGRLETRVRFENQGGR